MLEIGRVAKPHGLGGELVISLVSNVPERLAPGAVLTLRAATGEQRQLVVQSSRPFQHRHLVRFEGVSSREAAEALRGRILLAPELAERDAGALFVHELIGSEVVDRSGVSHGKVVAVEANPASDLLVGEPGWLVPLRFVTGTGTGRIVVDAPDGLFE